MKPGACQQQPQKAKARSSGPPAPAYAFELPESCPHNGPNVVSRRSEERGGQLSRALRSLTVAQYFSVDQAGLTCVVSHHASRKTQHRADYPLYLVDSGFARMVKADQPAPTEAGFLFPASSINNRGATRCRHMS